MSLRDLRGRTCDGSLANVTAGSRVRCYLSQGSLTTQAISLPTRPATSVRRRELPALTGVRFLAAWYVVLFHALPGLAHRYPVPRVLATFLGNGYLAVGLFFLLSGFILAYTYEGQITSSAGRIRFWEARFARIYPVYLLSLVLSYSLATDLHFGTRLAVLTMLQAWNPFNPDMAGAWNYPAWTLSAEAFFYLCFPFVFPWISRRSTRALFWLTAALLAVSVIGHTPVRGLGDWKHSAVLLERVVPLPVFRIPEFLLGAVLGLRFLRDKSAQGPASYPFRVYPAMFGTLVVLSLPLGDWVSLVILPFSVLVYELARGGSALAKFLSTRLMVLLGGASYAIYLLRLPVTTEARTLLSGLPSGVARFGELAAPLFLILFSILVFQYWEEPARKAIRRRFTKKQVRLAPLPTSASTSPASN
jgi:peptidoglycan/LPS O-acetylase OafA/YrhL